LAVTSVTFLYRERLLSGLLNALSMMVKMNAVTGARDRTALFALLVRAAGFLVLWIVLMGPSLKDLPLGMVAAAAATWASTALWPSDSDVSVVGVGRFVLRFLPLSVAAGVDVARHAFKPSLDLEPGFATHRTALPPGMARGGLCALMSLQPGKLPVAVAGDGTIEVHCLDSRQAAAEPMAADEAAFTGMLRGGMRNA
jgi:multicomponent Na+:H+ antiporter subunit E